MAVMRKFNLIPTVGKYFAKGISDPGLVVHNQYPAFTDKYKEQKFPGSGPYMLFGYCQEAWYNNI